MQASRGVRWGCCFWLLASMAHADALQKPALHWVRTRGAERCIDARALAERVEALIGPVLVAPAAAERSIEAEIHPRGRGFAVRIVSVARDGLQTGERELESADPDCRAFDAALAFVIALSLDPGLAARGIPDELHAFAQEIAPEEALLAELEASAASGPPRPSAAASELAAEPLQRDGSPAPRAASARSPFRYGVALGAAALARTLPSWAFGLELTAWLEPARSWPFALAARAFPEGATESLRIGERAAFAAYELELSLCPLALRRQRVRMRACLGSGLGHLTGRGVGFLSDRRSGIWDPTVHMSLLLGLELGAGFGLFAQARARVRLADGQFVFTQAEYRLAAFEPARIGAIVSAGPFYEF